jgi:hypothetical protein
LIIEKINVYLQNSINKILILYCFDNILRMRLLFFSFFLGCSNRKLREVSLIHYLYLITSDMVSKIVLVVLFPLVERVHI